MAPLFAAILVLQAVPVVLAAEEGDNRQVAVAVASGRRFVGEIDAKTDQEHLWLRSHREGIFLLRPIAWDRVIEVGLPEEKVSGAELLAAVKRLADGNADEASETEPPMGLADQSGDGDD